MSGESFGETRAPNAEAFDICGDIICDDCAERFLLG